MSPSAGTRPAEQTFANGAESPSSRVAPAGGPPPSSFRPERRRRGVEKPRACGCEVSPLRRAAHGSGRNDEGGRAPFERLLGISMNETLIPSSPRRGRIEGRPAFPPTSSFRPERRRRGVEKPRARGCEVSPLRRAAHGSGRNDEGGRAPFERLLGISKNETLIPSSPRRGRIEGRDAASTPSKTYLL